MKKLFRFPIFWACTVASVACICIWCYIITAPIPLTEEKMKDELLYYLTPIDIDMKAHDISLTFGKLLTRDTTRKKDIVEFTIVEKQRLDDSIHNYHYQETAIQRVFQYIAVYRYKNKEWKIEKVDNSDIESAYTPLAGVDAKKFVETFSEILIEHDEKGLEFVKQETDLQHGVDKLIVKETIENSLFKASCTIIYSFAFNKDQKQWEKVDTVSLNDWEAEYYILGRWQLAEPIGDTKEIYLDIESITDTGVLTATYRDIDNISDNVYLDWVGKVDKDVPYMFWSERDAKTLYMPYYEKKDEILFGDLIYKRQ